MFLFYMHTKDEMNVPEDAKEEGWHSSFQLRSSSQTGSVLHSVSLSRRVSLRIFQSRELPHYLRCRSLAQEHTMLTSSIYSQFSYIVRRPKSQLSLEQLSSRGDAGLWTQNYSQELQISKGLFYRKVAAVVVESTNLKKVCSVCSHHKANFVVHCTLIVQI